MDSLLLIASLILLGLVAFYTWFVFQLLQTVRRESHLYRSSLDQQLRLTTFPHLYCDLSSDRPSGTLTLEVYNIGSQPTTDILVSTIGTYTAETLDVATLMRNYIQPRHRKYPLQPDKVGYYGIRSSVRSPMLPYQKRLAIALQFPVCPVDVYALVQYRTIVGENYYQLYCFSELDDQGQYRANIPDAHPLTPIERIHFYDLDALEPPAREGSLPFPLVDFIDLWNHSISQRFTTLYTGDYAAPTELEVNRPSV
ncbi:MAG: hypothetical protein WBA43_15880 [Elainellaceae cyanobacterium]|jgi:hypothetical protein